MMNSNLLAQLTSGAILATGLLIAFLFGWLSEFIWRDRP